MEIMQQALCPGQIVRDKHKVSYAEAVKRVDREWGVGNVKVKVKSAGGVQLLLSWIPVQETSI